MQRKTTHAVTKKLHYKPVSSKRRYQTSQQKRHQTIQNPLHVGQKHTNNTTERIFWNRTVEKRKRESNLGTTLRHRSKSQVIQASKTDK